MAEPPNPRPNILFIIMDDVGMDQMQAFGYGGATLPATPNITQIADAGIRFRNTWSMPACSTSRAVLFGDATRCARTSSVRSAPTAISRTPWSAHSR
jgi:arylsulfatase A-like enzyme